jgi:D-alanyl-D-alanine carboxypeptidase
MASLFLFLVLSLAVPLQKCEDSGLLWLVNAENPLPATYEPDTLTTYNKVRLHPAACEAFKQLLTAMQEDGICGLHLHSAYRSYSRQKKIFAQKVRQYKSQGHSTEAAEALAARSVQRPGASEHQTGLALDVSTTGKLNQDFGETPAGAWLRTNAHRFGFIIRYPLTKIHTTQIIYEPWHLRYVGIPHAAIINERDLTLEEYADFLAAFAPYEYWTEEGEGYLVQFESPFCPQPADVVDITSVRFEQKSNIVITSRIPHPLVR